MDMTISSLVRDAFEQAESYYFEHFTNDHQRIDPDDDWDEARFLAWGRLWQVTLHTYNQMNNQSEQPEVPYTELLMRSYGLTVEEVLEAMYG